jgi:hypothetical protein
VPVAPATPAPAPVEKKPPQKAFGHNLGEQLRSVNLDLFHNENKES